MKMSRTVDELISKLPPISDWRQILESATTTLRAEGFEWSVDDTTARAVVVWPQIENGIRVSDGLIRLGVANRTPPMEQVIWDLLHELGHVLSGASGIPPGIKLSPDLVLEQQRREVKAWHRAWQWFVSVHPDGESFRNSFGMHAQNCLRSYNVSSDSFALPAP